MRSNASGPVRKEMKEDWFSVSVVGRRQEAQGIVALELASTDGGSLPAFEAGAHIDVKLPDGMVRQYSLLACRERSGAYTIGVLLSPASRGGSSYIHKKIQVGDHLTIGVPRNLFMLTRGNRRVILFAGGIGITPILAMAEALAQRNAEFDLHYSARSLANAAFRDRIAASGLVDRTYFYFNDADSRLRVADVLSRHPTDSDIYVCGPEGFMTSVIDAAVAAGWNRDCIHKENFSPASATSTEHEGPDGFDVRVASSGVTFRVTPGNSIAKVLLDNGIDIPVSCEQGICGCCMTGLLEGVPDHRDYCMSDEEHERNDMLTVCCSRSKTPLLVLDL
jgi:vanillate O-demethylase ferredoxin subunit